jgi:uncharacterized protein YqeY
MNFMSDTLKLRIQEDMKAAMRSQDKRRLGVIRLITSAIKQIEVDERIAIDDARLLSVLDKMIKQRRDSVTQYTQANRPDLVAQESFEITVIQEYLPSQLSDAELTEIIAVVLAETGATSVKDLGKVMTVLKPRVQGRADMAAVSARVKQTLN